MLIVLIYWLSATFGGSGGLQPFFERLEHATDFVKADIADATRREVLLDVLERTVSLRKAMDAHAEDLKEGMLALASKRDTSLAEFDQLHQDARERLVSDRSKLLDLRFELHDNLSRAEWAKAFADKPAG